MGISIDGRRYSVREIESEINKSIKKASIDISDKLTPAVLLKTILPAFGITDGDRFYVVDNEYYSDNGYNPGWEFIDLINRYYGIELPYISGEVFSEGANAYEVAEELGLELKDGDDDDW